MSSSTIMNSSPCIKVASVMGKMNSGGGKTLVMEYFRHIDRTKFDFHFICDSDSQAVPEEEISELGGTVHYVSPYQHIIRNIHDIEAVCKRERFDVVHAYGSTMNVFSMYAAKKAKVPVRISESISMGHGGEFKTYIKKALRPFSKLFATDFLSCGEACGRWQFGDQFYDQGNVRVFKTAIDAGKYAYSPELRMTTRKQLGIAPDEYVVGFIGRFEQQKNPLFLLDIFNEVKQINPQSKLLLIGDGSLRDEMMEFIDRNELRDSVIYLGRREDIVQYYQAMDCFLLPSLYEGLPIVGLEAQCAGLDVFFSDEITKEASFCDLGHFISLDSSSKSWANEMLSCFSQIDQRTSYSKTCSLMGYDSADEAERLSNLYLELVASHG